MKRVRMKTGITGTRNGQEWPPRGGECDLPDQEALDMAAAGYVDIVGDALDGDGSELEDLSLKQLRTLAAQTPDVDVPKRARREQIIAALRAHAEREAEDETKTEDTGDGQPGTAGSDGPPAGQGSEPRGEPADGPGTDGSVGEPGPTPEG